MTDAQFLILLRKYRDMLESAISEAQNHVHPDHIEREQCVTNSGSLLSQIPKTVTRTRYPTLVMFTEMIDVIDGDIEALEKVLER
jgi:hypothetical protein